ncbi:hypothetical protein ACRALDRAFT_211457 [Sodiomyces alcalophilus JCM 7366]|uniref:uncharacterized protein n=1 Tax=Sodiomyces alcalophilus JCM 7366 TaxID=591952 RepID=UPI0039B38743
MTTESRGELVQVSTLHAPVGETSINPLKKAQWRDILKPATQEVISTPTPTSRDRIGSRHSWDFMKGYYKKFSGNQSATWPFHSLEQRTGPHTPRPILWRPLVALANIISRIGSPELHNLEGSRLP